MKEIEIIDDGYSFEVRVDGVTIVTGMGNLAGALEAALEHVTQKPIHYLLKD